MTVTVTIGLAPPVRVCAREGCPHPVADQRDDLLCPCCYGIVSPEACAGDPEHVPTPRPALAEAPWIPRDEWLCPGCGECRRGGP